MKKYTLVDRDYNLRKLFDVNKQESKQNFKIVQKQSNVIRLTKVDFDPNDAA